MERSIHSLAQLELLRRMAEQPDLPARDALFLATQLVNHGFTEAGPLVAGLRAQIPDKPVQHFLARLARRDAAIQALPQLPALRADPAAVEQFYATDGYVFRPGTVRGDLAIVIFTTRCNNFSVSNLVLDALLGELGLARLYLKDGSADLYLAGVHGLAATLRELPEAIARLLAAHGVRPSVVTGFSSGGYASLYAAMRLRPHGYIGFSVCTDLSVASGLPQRKMFSALHGRAPADLLLDLRPEIARTGGRLTLCYGMRDPIDRAHAEHLAPCPGVTLRAHAEANHALPVWLLEEGRLLAPFQDMLDMPPGVMRA